MSKSMSSWSKCQREPLARSRRRRSALAMTPLRLAAAACAIVLVSSLTVEASSSIKPFIRSSPSEENDSRRDQRISNEDNEVPAVVRINPFDLDMQGVFVAPPTDKQVHSTLEDFLASSVGAKARQEGWDMQDLFLATTIVKPVGTRRRRELQGSSTLSVLVTGGVAYYTNEEFGYPDEGELEAEIQTSLVNDFPRYVNDTVSGATLNSVTYTSSTPPPTSAPLPAEGVQVQETNTDNSKKRGIIAAGATGAFLGILIVTAALLVRRSRRGPSLDEYLERGREAEPGVKDNATYIDSSYKGGGEEEEGQEDEEIGNSGSGETSGSSGLQQMQDDSSQWTLSTYPEDANTVLTFGTGKSAVTSNALDRTESFERDRQVSLRKDMLNTSPGWNATDTSNANDETARKIDDTVLQPSHFVTAEEHLQGPPPPPPPPPSSTSTGGTTMMNAPPSNTPRFAANDEGEEIYLMPPPSKKGAKVSFQEAAE